MTEKVVDMVNRPPHYNQRTAQCIEFTRHMSFTLGNAFKYLWREGDKDDTEQERAKTSWYIRDALCSQPFVLSREKANCLKMRLSMMSDEFDPEIWSILIAIIDASAGDCSLLLKIAIAKKMVTVSAADILGGSN